MSIFSQKLCGYVENASMKVTTLSRLSGVERSYIQKMLSGERLPKEYSILLRLSEALMLTPAESSSLREAYEISKMGESIYSRRMAVKDLLEEADRYLPPAIPSRPSPPQPPRKELPDLMPLEGRIAISDALQSFLAEETASSEAHLCAVIQPDCMAISQLQIYCLMNPKLRLEHIVCFDRNQPSQENQHYNLRCMRALLPFLLGSYQYSGWFYYDSISAQSSRTSVFPWFILGKNAVFSLSRDCEKAILYTQPQAVALFRRIFEEFRGACSPLFELENTTQSRFWNSSRWTEIQKQMTYSIQFEPCWGFFYTMDMIEKSMLPDLPNRETDPFLFCRPAKTDYPLGGQPAEKHLFLYPGRDRPLFNHRENLGNPRGPLYAPAGFRPGGAAPADAPLRGTGELHPLSGAQPEADPAPAPLPVHHR